MMLTSHIARITGPVSYLGPGGRQRHIPLGPCLIETAPEGASIDIVWGAQGQSSIALPWAQVQAAQQSGHLVLLDGAALHQHPQPTHESAHENR